MARRMSVDEAAALFEPRDTFAMPLGPGQPAGLLDALGERDDWEELRIGTALLFVFTPLFTIPNVHYLSGFFGPAERFLRDSGANISSSRPTSAASRRSSRPGPTRDGDRRRPARRRRLVSLSLHAGSTYDEMQRIAADPDRFLIAEVSALFPRTRARPDYPHRLHVDQIDVLVESDRGRCPLEDPPPGDAERAIAEHARRYIPDGATLQTGIGGIPSTIAGLLAEGDGGDYGVHSEMFTTGLMQLHKAGQGHQPRRASSTASRSRRSPAAPRSSTSGSTERRRALPPRRRRELARDDRPQPQDGDDQRRARGRPLGSGGRRHDRRPTSSRASAGTRTSSPVPRLSLEATVPALPPVDLHAMRTSAIRGSCPGSTSAP